MDWRGRVRGNEGAMYRCRVRVIIEPERMGGRGILGKRHIVHTALASGYWAHFWKWLATVDWVHVSH